MTSARAYADRLSAYGHKGKLDLPHRPDPALAVLHKSRILAQRIKHAAHVVVHTGAGISTAAGISDFRGPNGVWTLQQKPCKRPRTTAADQPSTQTSFEDALPTLTHMALVALHKASRVHYVVSQNVDGLHLRSGLPRAALSELHGNLFVEWCAACRRENILHTQTESVGLKPTGTTCPCGAPMTDKALDWNDVLPEPDFHLAKSHSSSADLNIVVGTSCQMEPARSLPFRGKHGKNSRAIVNLSGTDFDHRFGICIRASSDTVFAIVAAELAVSIPHSEALANLVLSVTYVLRGIQCNVFPSGTSSRERLRVRYRCVNNQPYSSVWTKPLSSFPYPCTLRSEGRHIQAEVTCGAEKVVFHAIAEPNKTVQTEASIVVKRKEWMQYSSHIIQQLKQHAQQEQQTYLQSLCTEQWFVTASRRGWSQCCLCWKQLWCRQNQKLEHLRQCIPSYQFR